MTTLYRPNHRFRGPIESGKQRTIRTNVQQGLERVQGTLNAILDRWDRFHADKLQGKVTPNKRYVRIVDLHPASGSFLDSMRLSIVGERRLAVDRAANWDEAIMMMEDGDVLAVGVGGLPKEAIPIDQLIELVGKTPLILGRSLLPYLEEVWPLLGVFPSSNSGRSLPLQARGLEPRIYPSETAPSNTVIPDDALAAQAAPIMAGDHEHMFYVAYGLNSIILSISANTPGQTTIHERQWSYYALEQWLSPAITALTTA